DVYLSFEGLKIYCGQDFAKRRASLGKEREGASRLRVFALPLSERRQRTPIHLAVCVFRNRVDDDDGGGHLERGELAPAVLEQCGLRWLSAGTRHDETHAGFAISMAVHADAVRVRDGRLQ